MTKQEFDLKYRGENIAVHCDTEEKAKAFLSLAKSFGYVWGSGDDLKKYHFWYINVEDTCYSFNENGVMTDNKSYYIRKSYTIVPFELDEPKETFNVGDVVYDNNGAKAVVKRLFYELEYEDGHYFKKAHETLTHQKPLKEINEKELAEMGFVLKK